MLYLTADEIIEFGFQFHAGLVYDKVKVKQNAKKFKVHYGVRPVVAAAIWGDFQEVLEPKWQSTKGLRYFFIVLFFLWNYPKNASILASTFSICKRLVEGPQFWGWIEDFAMLSFQKIMWPGEYNDPNHPHFICSVDGVDFITYERQHPEFPIDKTTMSHKFKHGAVKYEVAIDVFKSKVVWISGPYKGGVHDKVIFSNGLKNMIPAGKKVICDRVYGSQQNVEDHAKLALPSRCDAPRLHNFKARVRARHESFNGRLKTFKCLKDEFRHRYFRHEAVFRSVVTILIYGMEFGAPLFDP